MAEISMLAAWQEHNAASYGFACRAARIMKIGLAEVAALEQIRLAGPLTPGQLGLRLSMPSGSVTNLIDRLEGKRFVSRKPNPSDRRGYLIHLSEEALQKASRDLLPMAQKIEAISSELSSEERKIVSGWLHKIATALAE